MKFSVVLGDTSRVKIGNKPEYITFITNALHLSERLCCKVNDLWEGSSRETRQLIPFITTEDHLEHLVNIDDFFYFSYNREYTGGCKCIYNDRASYKRLSTDRNTLIKKKYGTEKLNLKQMCDMLVELRDDWGQQLLDEWDHEENDKAGLNMEDCTPGNKLVAHWECRKGHKWKATISNRVRGSKCPVCTAYTKTSFPEQVIYRSLKTVFPNTENRKIMFKSEDNKRGFEYDVYVPDLKLLIEYNGANWHEEKEDRDALKRRLALENGFKFISILEDCTSEECFEGTELCVKPNSKKSLKKIIDYILSSADIEYIIDYRRVYREANEYSQGKVEYKDSLACLHPEIASEFASDLNGSASPKEISYGSSKIYWWRCKKHPEHVWEMAISDRVCKGENCPYCASRKILVGYNDMATAAPHLIEEWDYEKNDRTPQEVMRVSTYKAWWICKKNPNHRWQTAVYCRTTDGQGCPYCSGKRVYKGENDLATLRPRVADDWDYEKNEFGPDEVTVSSGKKVYWKCSKNPNHKWRAAINDRSRGDGCPYCSGIKILTGETDFATLKPDLLEEWDFDRNEISPSEIGRGSNHKAWWICKKNPEHRWQAVVSSRCRGAGCPICAKIKNKIKIMPRWQ